MPREELEEAYIDLMLLVEALDELKARREIRDRERVSQRARKGANVSHAEDRKKKATVQKAYLEGEDPIKDSAAETLSNEHGIPFRTARKYLVGVDHPLQHKT